jgi:hypothetical protein
MTFQQIATSKYTILSVSVLLILLGGRILYGWQHGETQSAIIKGAGVLGVVLGSVTVLGVAAVFAYSKRDAMRAAAANLGVTVPSQ